MLLNATIKKKNQENSDRALLFASIIMILKKSNLTFFGMHSISVPPARQTENVSFILLQSNPHYRKSLPPKEIIEFTTSWLFIASMNRPSNLMQSINLVMGLSKMNEWLHMLCFSGFLNKLTSKNTINTKCKCCVKLVIRYRY